MDVQPYPCIGDFMLGWLIPQTGYPGALYTRVESKWIKERVENYGREGHFIMVVEG